MNKFAVKCWNCKGKGKMAFDDGRTVTPNTVCRVCKGMGELIDLELMSNRELKNVKERTAFKISMHGNQDDKEFMKQIEAEFENREIGGCFAWE
jgi:DnaJ-class molecular chaperone